MKPFGFKRVMDGLAFTANAHRPAMRKREKDLVSAYDVMSDQLKVLNAIADPLEQNIRKILFVRVFRGLSGALLNSAHGLSLEAVLCLRSSLDAFCYDLAIQIEPAFLQRYENKTPTTPEELRGVIREANHGAWAFIEEKDGIYSSADLGREFIFSLTEKDRKGGRHLHIAFSGQDDEFVNNIVTQVVELSTEYIRYA